MSDKTTIEWTDATWNPLRGCSRVSEGCKNCYAERVAARFGGHGAPYAGTITAGRWNGKIRTVPEVLDQPLHWKRPRRIFVNSMSDLFHENVPEEFIARVFDVMARAPQHTFQVLTKRPERMLQIMAGPKSHEYWPSQMWHRSVLPNVWLGVSVENQRTADERVPLLQGTPAAVRFLSCEPLLGPVDLAASGALWSDLNGNIVPKALQLGRQVDWVICGGESGHGARAMRPEWPKALRDQCKQAGVPFFFKQWGEWATPSEMPVETAAAIEEYGEGMGMSDNPLRVGKKRAGRLLDGQVWDEFPGRAA